MNFVPRAVPRSSWRRWLACGVALATRRVGAFVLFGSVCVVLHAVPAAIGFGTVAVPVAFGIGCLIAECSDRGRAILPALRAKPWRVHARLLFAGGVAALGFWLVGALVSTGALVAGIDPAAIGASPGAASRSLADMLCAAWFLSAAAVLFGTSVAIGFLVPLLALGELPLKEASLLSLVATGRNVFAMLLVAGLAVTALVGLITPFLVVPWTAIVSATLYAGYRDVFLGRSDNAPEVVRQGVRGRGRATSVPRVRIHRTAMAPTDVPPSNGERWAEGLGTRGRVHLADALVPVSRGAFTR